MKAITIRQPWASAIFYRGKDIENRSWATHYRGPLAVHAGVVRLKDAWWPRGVPKIDESELAYGAVIGVVDLVDVVERSRSRWFSGPFGFVFANPRPLRQPIAVKGALNLWNLPSRVEKRLVAQLGEVSL